ncbi:hypothetical protein Marpi_1508 [Marinitoga piezophila KA3]|uniref:Uncharacterized protein n=1 Tax=Marinitoga piezophila (strain DSM 14283 / JCM 11233 / KA3) TaxID=443254 RepID=H2J488_MARPK|nr:MULTISPECIES: hypothetical protein [Marinitoga]AEX85903.1 hypothetical protein Marpi_1508 [Marinitoga piezophila KA3]
MLNERKDENIINKEEILDFGISNDELNELFSLSVIVICEGGQEGDLG